MKILFASSELHPLIKTGGLADVSAHLPKALHALGLDIRIIIPGYKYVINKINCKCLKTFLIDGQKVRLLETRLPETTIPVWIVDCPSLFMREGGPYQDSQGYDWPDNAQRFSLFCKAIAYLSSPQNSLDWRPDIVHCNDWQTGLVPALLSLESTSIPTLFTIHNLAYQGLFPYATFLELGLPHNLWSPQSLEFYNQMSFIKGGLVYATQISTVSPRYAKEIKTPQFGCGLDGLLRHRSRNLCGILNGIDEDEWSPETDKHLHRRYNRNSLETKSSNKEAVQALFNLPTTDNQILIGIVSRLTQQKGIDLIVESLPELMQYPWQMAILGNGDKTIESALRQMADKYPDRIGIKIAHNEGWAHLLIGGSDAFLMPSRFEPCGLTQMYSLRYGTIPVVTKVGGLADTVRPATAKTLRNQSATGILITQPNSDAVIRAVRKCLKLWQQPALWRQLQLTAMTQEYPWITSAQQYMKLYSKLLKRKPGRQQT